MKVNNIIPWKIVSSSPMDATTFNYEVCTLPKQLDEEAEELPFFWAQ